MKIKLLIKLKLCLLLDFKIHGFKKIFNNTFNFMQHIGLSIMRTMTINNQKKFYLNTVHLTIFLKIFHNNL